MLRASSVFTYVRVEEREKDEELCYRSYRTVERATQLPPSSIFDEKIEGREGKRERESKGVSFSLTANACIRHEPRA